MMWDVMDFLSDLARVGFFLFVKIISIEQFWKSTKFSQSIGHEKPTLYTVNQKLSLFLLSLSLSLSQTHHNDFYHYLT